MKHGSWLLTTAIAAGVLALTGFAQQPGPAQAAQARSGPAQASPARAHSAQAGRTATPVTGADRLAMLKNALLLEKVPAGELDQLAALVRLVELKGAETFAVRGQPSPGMVLVGSGGQRNGVSGVEKSRWPHHECLP